MRSFARLAAPVSALALLLGSSAASPAHAQEPAPPAAPEAATPNPSPSSTPSPAPSPSSNASPASNPNETAPAAEPLPPSTPPAATAPAAESPAPGADTPADPDATKDGRRAEGVRLGIEIGYSRASSSTGDTFSAGSPSLIPIGVDVSLRVTERFLVGLHVSAALASRNDCLSADSCRARAYAFGPHVELPIGRGQTFVPFFRFGMTYEILYQGGRLSDPTGYVYRQAIDFMDARFGGDFIVSRGSAGKTTRIGGYLGLATGVMTGQSGISHLAAAGGRPRNLERDMGEPHVWFGLGLRATIDP